MDKITMKQRIQYLYYRLRYELQSPLFKQCSPLFKQYTLSDVLCLVALFLITLAFVYTCLIVGIKAWRLFIFYLLFWQTHKAMKQCKLSAILNIRTSCLVMLKKHNIENWKIRLVIFAVIVNYFSTKNKSFINGEWIW